MRILVTGGAGYIGSHTLIELLAAGHQVCVVDNFSNSTPDTLRRVQGLSRQLFDVMHLDIRDTERLTKVVRNFRPDAVLHFAALKSVPEGERRPLEYFDVNVGGTISLLNSIEGSMCRQIVYSSTAAVYGEPENAPVTETQTVRPCSVYGRSKYMAEQVIESWIASSACDVSATLLRYFNPIGAHPSAELSSFRGKDHENLVPRMMQVAAGSRIELDVYGTDYATPDGSCIRDFIHVVDLAKAHIAALEDRKPSTGKVRIYNLGTGQGASVLEIVRTFQTLSRKKIPLNLTARRHGDVAEIFASSDKAERELGWRAHHGLEEMLRSGWHAFEHH